MESITKLLAKELQKEAGATRKMLSIVPNDKYSWRPHAKSMDIKNLATHIADLASWPELVLRTQELDFENNTHEIEDINATHYLVEFFDRSLEKSVKALENAQIGQLDEDWTLRSGEHIISTESKYDVIRMAIAQQIHHRAQLGVYLRLLNIPIPGSYGPSADEPF